MGESVGYRAEHQTFDQRRPASADYEDVGFQCHGQLKHNAGRVADLFDQIHAAVCVRELLGHGI